MKTATTPLFHDQTWMEYFSNMGPSAPIITLVSLSLLLYLCALIRRQPSTQDLIVYYFSALLPIIIGTIGTIQGIIRVLDALSYPGIWESSGAQRALIEILPCLAFGASTTAVFLAFGFFFFACRKPAAK